MIHRILHMHKRRLGLKLELASLRARFMGPTWSPSGADRTQVGSMLALWTLLSGMPFFDKYTHNILQPVFHAISWHHPFENSYEIFCSKWCVKYLSHKWINICPSVRPLFTSGETSISSTSKYEANYSRSAGRQSKWNFIFTQKFMIFERNIGFHWVPLGLAVGLDQHHKGNALMIQVSRSSALTALTR